jgi:hypothetical protein
LSIARTVGEPAVTEESSRHAASRRTPTAGESAAWHTARIHDERIPVRRITSDSCPAAA